MFYELRYRVPLIFIFLSLAACDEGVSSVQRSNSEHPPSQSGSAIFAGTEKVVGTWTAVRETCQSGSEIKPSENFPTTSLTLSRDGRYRRVEGSKTVRGSYAFVTNRNREAVELDANANLARYELRKGQLENWGEGEAVYPCALVFQRMPDATSTSPHAHQ